MWRLFVGALRRPRKSAAAYRTGRTGGTSLLRKAPPDKREHVAADDAPRTAAGMPPLRTSTQTGPTPASRGGGRSPATSPDGRGVRRAGRGGPGGRERGTLRRGQSRRTAAGMPKGCGREPAARQRRDAAATDAPAGAAAGTSSPRTSPPATARTPALRARLRRGGADASAPGEIAGQPPGGRPAGRPSGGRRGRGRVDFGGDALRGFWPPGAAVAPWARGRRGARVAGIAGAPARRTRVGGARERRQRGGRAARRGGTRRRCHGRAPDASTAALRRRARGRLAACVAIVSRRTPAGASTAAPQAGNDPALLTTGLCHGRFRGSMTRTSPLQAKRGDGEG